MDDGADVGALVHATASPATHSTAPTTTERTEPPTATPFTEVTLRRQPATLCSDSSTDGVKAGTCASGSGVVSRATSAGVTPR